MLTPDYILWPHVPRLAADDPARRIMAANLAAEHNRQTQPWHAMGRTLHHQQARRVYEALCGHCNEGGECWPPRERLAALTGMAEGDVTRAMRRLRRLGYVETVLAGRRGRATVHFLPDVRAAVVRHKDADDARLRIHSQPFEAWWDRGVQVHAEPFSTLVDARTATPLAGELLPQSHSENPKEAYHGSESIRSGVNFCSGCGTAFPPSVLAEHCVSCGRSRDVSPVLAETVLAG